MITNTTQPEQPRSIWVDLASPSHPFFFESLLSGLTEFTVATTVRDKSETVGVARAVGLDANVVGRDFDNVSLRKLGIPIRAAQLAVNAPPSGVSLSARNAMCILASHIRRIPSIHFTDNDITAYVDGLWEEELYHQLEATATYNVVPSAFEESELTMRGISSAKIRKYDGYMEDVHVARFEPDPTYPERLPFDDYVIIRPEALTATYVDETESLVPELLERFTSAGISVVYLPRGRGDEKHADAYSDDRVFVPEITLNGLQLAWHSRCVLTGSGTMGREAACMGKPAVSFFPYALLSVDRALVREGHVYHSRDPADVVEYVESLTQDEIRPDTSRSEAVYREVINLTRELIKECLEK